MNKLFNEFLKNRTYVSIMCYGESLAENNIELFKTQSILIIGFIIITTVILIWAHLSGKL